jgi:hypothetical protein
MGKIRYTILIEKFEYHTSMKNWNVECKRIKKRGRKRTTRGSSEHYMWCMSHSVTKRRRVEENRFKRLKERRRKI